MALRILWNADDPSGHFGRSTRLLEVCLVRGYCHQCGRWREDLQEVNVMKFGAVLTRNLCPWDFEDWHAFEVQQR